ncbi:ABC transporter ATP-binding protein [Alteromonas sp. ASW11-130]|uniref:ABC transporter ATP-binding protein n=1 Tax=Alteromonas sp. ASW11-130 TaxID=3015775 RepID=UPI002241E3E0|nr:ATP-binding cassette domain-containing protein [Alteromonas sp. ASW11-130]MCW8093063.1 ATP-binding cassette domain-containing protein [Alteromonas sp. ASW11-130]
MISISDLAKKFKVENPKKLSDQEKRDPRLKGKFFHSVKDVSFYCEKGQVLGLLGPNGAGKTTTLRMLSTALKPDTGEILLEGVNVVKDPLLARKKIGYLSGATGLYGKLTGRENITYFAQLHGMRPHAIKQKIDQLANTLDLHSFLDRRCANYSTGMKQRIAIARTVVHDPKVVILDEPTTGLDIMATQTVLNFIRGLKNNGVPVIFSTHHLAEVDELCDRVTVINQGVTEFDDSISAFRALAPQSMHQAFLHTLRQDVQLCG